MPKINGDPAVCDLSSDMIPARILVEDITIPGTGRYFLYQDDWEGYTSRGNWVETNYPEVYSKRSIRPESPALCFRNGELSEKFPVPPLEGGDKRDPLLVAMGGSDLASTKAITQRRPVLLRENMEKEDFSPVFFLDE